MVGGIHCSGVCCDDVTVWRCAGVFPSSLIFVGGLRFIEAAAAA